MVASDEGGEVAVNGTDREDEGTVVGAMVSGNTVHVEQAASVGGVKAVQAILVSGGIAMVEQIEIGGLTHGGLLDGQPF